MVCGRRRAAGGVPCPGGRQRARFKTEFDEEAQRALFPSNDPLRHDAMPHKRWPGHCILLAEGARYAIDVRELEFSEGTGGCNFVAQ